MPSIRKDGNRYRVRGRNHAGKDVRLTAPSRPLAEELAAKIVEDRIRHRHGLHIDQERVTFKVAWDEWLARYKAGGASRVKPSPATVRAVQERRAALRPLDSLYLEEVGQAQLERVGVKLVAEGKAALASRAVGLAKRVIRDAQDRDIRVNPSVFRVSFPVPAPRDARAFTWGEVELLASFVPERLRRGVLLLALTGLRISEFCALTDADVVLADSPHFLIRKSKTIAGVRRVYLTDHAAMLVREQMLARPASTVLFPNEHGQPYDRHEMYGYIHRAGHHSGLGPVRPHELRHTAVSLYGVSGVPFDVVRQQLGWSERTAALMWQKYRRLYEGEAAMQVQRLDAFITSRHEEAALA